jgi:enterochelin esterase-like enzyme
VQGSFASAAGTLAYDVYLPPGYDSSAERYPVIYYLPGLPARPTSYRRFVYVAQALELSKLTAIVVAPQGASERSSDPEYLNKGAGQDWETALAVQLPALVDRSYRTIATREGRALVGVSAGGYGAMLMGLHHLGRYAAIESWSGYFHPTDPTGTRSISSRAWLSASSFVSSLNRAFVFHPTFIAFYVGDQDTLFRAENVQLARQLSHAHVPFYFRIYPGGHTQQLWTHEAPSWLSMLLAHLDQPAPG